MRWPVTIAPFEAVVIPVNSKDEAQSNAAKQIYTDLMTLGVDVLLDDRDERIGVKFKDSDLIGYPYRIVVGRALAEGNVELVNRRDKANPRIVPLAEAAGILQVLIEDERASLQPKV